MFGTVIDALFKISDNSPSYLIHCSFSNAAQPRLALAPMIPTRKGFVIMLSSPELSKAVTTLGLLGATGLRVRLDVEARHEPDPTLH